MGRTAHMGCGGPQGFNLLWQISAQRRRLQAMFHAGNGGFPRDSLRLYLICGKGTQIGSRVRATVSHKNRGAENRKVGQSNPGGSMASVRPIVRMDGRA